jgi:hypothetical protein
VAGTGATGQNLTITATNAAITIQAPSPTASPTPKVTASPTPTASGATTKPTTSPTPTVPGATTKPTASPTATATTIVSPSPVSYRNEDINQDTKVDIADYLLLFQYYSRVNPSLARTDINKDAIVNIKDYALLYQAFGF